MYAFSALLTSLALAAVTPGGAPAPRDRDRGPVVIESAPSEPRHTVRYQTGARGVGRSDLRAFRASVTATLDDERGWSRGGAVRFVPARRDSDLRIWLASPAEVAAAHPSCDALFSCRVGPDVYINVTRWRDGPTGAWPQPLAAYKSYVVNHEVGHWLGLQHRECPARGAVAPVMMQQSIALDGCTARTWPLPGELRRAVQHLGDTLE